MFARARAHAVTHDSPDPERQAPPAVDRSEPPPATCLTCGAERLGDYCQACGQRHLDGRLTVGRLWRDFVSRAFSLDRGLVHTLARLAGGPGRVPADVVVGRSRPYTHPLSFYLLVSAISLLSVGLYADDLIDLGMSAGASAVQIDDAPDPAAQADTRVVTPGDRLQEAAERLNGEDGKGIPRRVSQISRRLNTPLLFLFALIAVVPFRLVFGKQRNLAETAVFALYVVGFATLVIAILSPPLIWIFGAQTGAVLLSIGTFAVYSLIPAWGAVAFWRPGIGTIAKAVLAGLLSFALYSVVSGVIALVVLLAELLGEAGLHWSDLLPQS